MHMQRVHGAGDRNSMSCAFCKTIVSGIENMLNHLKESHPPYEFEMRANPYRDMFKVFTLYPKDTFNLEQLSIQLRPILKRLIKTVLSVQPSCMFDLVIGGLFRAPIVLENGKTVIDEIQIPMRCKRTRLSVIEIEDEEYYNQFFHNLMNVFRMRIDDLKFSGSGYSLIGFGHVDCELVSTKRLDKIFTG